MTLEELRAEKRKLTSLLLADDCTTSDAKQFKQVCDAIRYLQEIKDWATKLNAGKASEAQISINCK